jgi:hypothetical protein
VKAGVIILAENRGLWVAKKHRIQKFIHVACLELVISSLRDPIKRVGMQDGAKQKTGMFIEKVLNVLVCVNLCAAVSFERVNEAHKARNFFVKKIIVFF